MTIKTRLILGNVKLAICDKCGNKVKRFTRVCPSCFDNKLDGKRISDFLFRDCVGSWQDHYDKCRLCGKEFGAEGSKEFCDTCVASLHPDSSHEGYGSRPGWGHEKPINSSAYLCDRCGGVQVIEVIGKDSLRYSYYKKGSKERTDQPYICESYCLETSIENLRIRAKCVHEYIDVLNTKDIPERKAHNDAHLWCWKCGAYYVCEPNCFPPIAGFNGKQENLSREDIIESGRKFYDAFELELKSRGRENDRRLVIKGIGYLLAFIGGYGLFFSLVHLTGVTRLFDVLWLPLGGFLLYALLVGCIVFPVITFFWLSDKTGLHYLIEDWIESWDTWDTSGSHNILKFKEFPRKERRVLVRNLDKVLNKISYGLMNLEREADNNDNEKLSDSVERIDELIGDLPYVSSAFLSLGLFREHAPWKRFTLTLEETAEGLKLELADIAKYHEKVQPALELSSFITENVLSIIVDKDNRKQAKKNVSLLIQALHERQNS